MKMKGETLIQKVWFLFLKLYAQMNLVSKLLEWYFSVHEVNVK